MNDLFVLGGLVFGALVLGVLVGFCLERRDWNGGTCRKSGKGWVRFSEDSTGSRGYTDGLGNICWISYSSVDGQ